MKPAVRLLITLLLVISLSAFIITGTVSSKDKQIANGLTTVIQFVYSPSESESKDNFVIKQSFLVPGTRREILALTLEKTGEGIFEEFSMKLTTQIDILGAAGVKGHLRIADNFQLDKGQSYKVLFSYDGVKGEVSARLISLSDMSVYYDGFITVGKYTGKISPKTSASGDIKVSWSSIAGKYTRSGLPGGCGDELGAYLTVADDVYSRGEVEVLLNKPDQDLKGCIALVLRNKNSSKEVFRISRKELPFEKRVPISGLTPGDYTASLYYIDGGYRVSLAEDKFKYWEGKLFAVLDIPEERPWVTGGTVSGQLHLRSTVPTGAVTVAVSANASNSGSEQEVYRDQVKNIDSGGLIIPISFKPDVPDTALALRVDISAKRGVRVMKSVRYMKREFYVSPSGSDSWSGRLSEPNSSGSDGPFATLDRAKAAIGELRENGGLPEGGVTVWIRGGTYLLGSAFTLTELDSGEESAPISYMAYKDEKPIFTGGLAINGFTRYKGNIMAADLTSQGITDIAPPRRMSRGNSDLPSIEVFYKGVRQTLARWPNKNSIRDGEWAYTSAATLGVTDSFGYSGDRPKNWSSLKDAQAVVWPSVNWHDEIVPVASVDVEKKMILLGIDTEYEILPGRRFYIQGVLEELDAPGEWYIDREKSILYFLPPEPIKSNEVVISAVEKGIDIYGCSYLTVQGLTFEAIRGTAVSVHNGQSVKIAKCTIRNTGGYGAEVIDSSDSGIIGCDIYETGRGGIILSGGDRASLSPGNNYAENNHIYNYGRLVKCYQAGINISGVGNRLRHNLIHDGPHNAILLSGNDHLIEYNEIHHVCMEGADSGAFYMGRDWSMRGNVLRYNYFHDIAGYGLQNEDSRKGPWVYESPHAAWAIYLDDCASGTTVFGNIFARVPLGAVMIGGGRDNIVENNIIIESSPAVHLDARWDEYPHYFTTQKDALDAVRYTEPPYSVRYPELTKIYDGDPRIPSGNSIVRNIISYSDDNWRGSWNMSTGRANAVLWEFQNYAAGAFTVDYNLIWHDNKPVRVDSNPYLARGGVAAFTKWQGTGFDRNSVIEDPLLAVTESGGYRVSIASPAYKLGFKEIPTDMIGLYNGDMRASWPVQPDVRKDGLTLVRERVSEGEWKD